MSITFSIRMKYYTSSILVKNTLHPLILLDLQKLNIIHKYIIFTYNVHNIQ